MCAATSAPTPAVKASETLRFKHQMTNKMCFQKKTQCFGETLCFFIETRNVSPKRCVLATSLPKATSCRHVPHQHCRTSSNARRQCVNHDSRVLLPATTLPCSWTSLGKREEATRRHAAVSCKRQLVDTPPCRVRGSSSTRRRVV
jgi:hypothetical protein